ncbi:helix-turn-helix transcriptional regulator [bacterium]|nr:helix-turn-helix transcriptional regulator [bacterium]
MDLKIEEKAVAKELRESARKTSRILGVLSNEDRLLLLCFLLDGELNVGELESSVGIKQPTLSQQLGVLRQAGVVNTRRDGKSIYYSVEDPRIFKLIETLHELFCSNQKGS